MKNTSVMFFMVVSASVAQAAVTLGPDAYGYVLNQSSNPGAYASIVGLPGTTQLTTSGTTADDVTFTANLDFDFNFYGTTTTQVFVSTNGFIAFGGNTGSATGGSYNNPDISQSTILVTGGTGAPTTERALMSPFWDDLYFAGVQPGALLTQSRTVGAISEFVVQWNNVQFFSAQTTPMTVQAILRSDGSFSFYYPDVLSAAAGTGGAQATVGIHDLNGGGGVNRFLQYSFNTAAALTSGDVIHFTVVPEPGTGLLALGSMAGLLMRRHRRN